MAEITILQIRAARSLLDWAQPDLANAAGVSLSTLKRYEGGASVSSTVRDVLIRALEDAGAVFINETGHVGVTVKVRRTK